DASRWRSDGRFLPRPSADCLVMHGVWSEWSATLADIGGIVASLALVLAYGIYLKWRQKTDPYYSVHAVGNLARSAWVEHIMESGTHDVLAVQTLRNSVMASSFMASTAILLMVGVLSLSGSLDRGDTLWRALNIGTGHDKILALKVVLLLIDFLVAFFYFSMAVRFFNHVGYLVNLPKEVDPGAFSPARVAVYLNRAGKCYAVGMRSFFFAVPLVFWLFGPHFMLVATAVVILGLYQLDRAPGARVRKKNPA